jgi:hypothetical protein
VEVLGLRFRKTHLTPQFLNSLIVRLVSLFDPYRRVNPLSLRMDPYSKSILPQHHTRS